MASILDITGKPTASEPIKLTIHSKELHFSTIDPHTALLSCHTLSRQPDGSLAVAPGFDPSAAFVFMETAQALKAMRERIDALEAKVKAASGGEL